MSLPTQVGVQHKIQPPLLTKRLHIPKDNQEEYIKPLGLGLQAFQDIPGDVSSLTAEGVSHCLQLLNLQAYVPAFKVAKVDGPLLRTYTLRYLVERFGMSYTGAYSLLRFAHEGLIPKK